MATMVMEESEIMSKELSHHGLVAALCHDINLETLINDKIGSSDSRRTVNPGIAVISMIINGLGFTNHRLYISPDFWKNKAVDRLLGEQYEAKDFNEKSLGKTLDDIHNYGTTKLYSEIVFGITSMLKLDGRFRHLDSTSFKYHGQASEGKDDKEEIRDEDDKLISISHGHSKDHRPDLKQITLNLVMGTDANIPVWINPLDGNSSDKTSFHDTIKQYDDFTKNLDMEDYIWVADSALYTKTQLLSENTFQWITRVPEIIKPCKEWVLTPNSEIEFEDFGCGYQAISKSVTLENINQRWLLVYSEQAYKREIITLDKRVEKEKAIAEKNLKSLSKSKFGCEKDAQKEVDKINKGLKFHEISVSNILAVEKYDKAGRPNDCSKKVVNHYILSGSINFISSWYEIEKNKKGKFVLATNEMNLEVLSDQEILSSYKKQSTVERGFRFLKDDSFMLNKMYLRSPARIEAFTMIMTLCLMINNLAEYTLRQALERLDETLPNQKKKEIKNPSMKWVFELMAGVTTLYLDSTDVRILNINAVRRKIIGLMGCNAMQIYGLI